MIDLHPKPDGYDERYWLSLKGVSGLADGEALKLCLGESVVCGRSRHCEWSLKRAPGYLGLADDERAAVRATDRWRTTSRRHCRVTYLAPDLVEVQNLSANGTYVDAHKIDRIVLSDVRQATHVIRMGPEGVELRLAPGSLPVEVLESPEG